jgi:alkylation response protein AidB-like acyl-CoA dehydrogenase
MDLELSDEQRWLKESVETLLEREWPATENVAGATAEQRRRVWERLVEFGALSIGPDDGLGAVELCVIGHALGSRLASVPFLGSAAVRLALAPFAETLDDEVAGILAGDDVVAIALLEPRASWSVADLATTAQRDCDALVLDGEKVAIEHLGQSDRLAVVTALDDRPGLVLIPVDAPGLESASQPSFDATVPMASARLAGVRAPTGAALAEPASQAAVDRLTTLGALLTAAEAIGAASAVLALAVRYAGERRQFGRPIGSFQALRHLLADLYVRQASGWSTVLFAAAAFDDDAPDATRTASVAKAYVSRGAREVAHGAMQVFGGIAFTSEHPAHRFLRRILVREQQFGDAAYHERELGRVLAAGGSSAAGRVLAAGGSSAVTQALAEASRL